MPSAPAARKRMISPTSFVTPEWKAQLSAEAGIETTTEQSVASNVGVAVGNGYTDGPGECYGSWGYQWCTEMVQPFTEGTDKDMFYCPNGGCFNRCFLFSSPFFRTRISRINDVTASEERVGATRKSKIILQTKPPCLPSNVSILMCPLLVSLAYSTITTTTTASQAHSTQKRTAANGTLRTRAKDAKTSGASLHGQNGQGLC